MPRHSVRWHAGKSSGATTESSCNTNRSCWSLTEQWGRTPARSPAKIVIVGGGAAGFAAAEKLRRERYEGDLVMVSGEEVPPVDRPNLSKDYLAGKAPEE